MRFEVEFGHELGGTARECAFKLLYASVSLSMTVEGNKK